MRERPAVGFSDGLKLEVKRRANFTCCYCREPDPVRLQVHHILPQGHGGEDNWDNAAPLCPNCHDSYGGNPNLKAEVMRRRDHWYEHVAREHSNLVTLVEMVAKARGLFVERRRLSVDHRKSEIDVLVCQPQVFRNCIGFSVQPWPDPVPESRVRELVQTLRESAGHPGTMLGQLVIVTNPETCMEYNSGEKTDPLYMNNARRWGVTFGGRTNEFIRFETEHTLNMFLDCWIDERTEERTRRLATHSPQID